MRVLWVISILVSSYVYNIRAGILELALQMLLLVHRKLNSAVTTHLLSGRTFVFTVLYSVLKWHFALSQDSMRISFQINTETLQLNYVSESSLKNKELVVCGCKYRMRWDNIVNY